jgi:hypothetical protein
MLVLVLRSRWSGNFLLEPEPKFFGLATAPDIEININVTKSPKFFILKFEVISFFKKISTLFALKNLLNLMIIYVLKSIKNFSNHENF